VKYYRRYMGDYARDTGHLTALQHGFYTLLLDWQYAKRAPIPAQIASAYSIAKAHRKNERELCLAVLEEFFPVTDGERWNKRAKQEITKGETAIDAMREAGKKGAAMRWPTPRKPDSLPHSLPHEVNHGVPIDPPTTNQEQGAFGAPVPDPPIQDPHSEQGYERAAGSAPRGAPGSPDRPRSKPTAPTVQGRDTEWRPDQGEEARAARNGAVQCLENWAHRGKPPPGNYELLEQQAGETFNDVRTRLGLLRTPGSDDDMGETA